MTNKEWEKEYIQKRTAILDKLFSRGFKIPEIVKYFRFDNMVIFEPNYCPLYKTRTRCHNIKFLNCFFCGCPYFEMLDEKSSTCFIQSPKRKTLRSDNKLICDCSNCNIPHSDREVYKFLKLYKDFPIAKVSEEELNDCSNHIKKSGDTNQIMDTYSSLDRLREFQWRDFLGKFKVF